ncbi:hypothetical protein FCM35_KLT16605 [Carex littledalei]|uniref:Uncharacterized protein n=1 Tax=Carex littledalei TaxID=544730 RepID=A0A833W0B5_9POAL|nr:hypothetical protein FCM35_KLT16605 [Carex littledalei]
MGPEAKEVNEQVAERNTRGPMTCVKLDRLLKKDGPTGLEFDDYGRGKEQSEWSSYIYLQARRQIKITHETWKHVPDDEKYNAWLNIMEKKQKSSVIVSGHLKGRRTYSRLNWEIQSMEVEPGVLVALLP